MNDLQLKEFDILKEFVRICEELGLNYYLVCGSALGASKYQGFIPWDDDIDIGMPRLDYNIFINKAKDRLPSHYFIQNYKTDPRFPLLFSKIRDARTTFIETGLSKIDLNQGVYIDIFPIDGYPNEKKQQKKLEIEKFILKFNSSCAIKTNSKMKFMTRFFLKVERLLGFHKRTAQTLDKLTSKISEYKTVDSLIWCNHGNWQGKLEYAPKEQYGNGAWATFEGLKVRIPEKYDEYLTQKYGDWRADLPEDQKVGHHYAEVIDLNRPYTDYIFNLGKGKIRLKTSEELKRDGINPPEGYRY